MKKVTKIGLSQVKNVAPQWLKVFCNFWIILTASLSQFMTQWGFSDLNTTRTMAFMTLVSALLVGLKAITGTEPQSENPYKP